MPDILWRFRLAPNAGFEYVSPSVFALTGYTPAEHYTDPDLGRRIVHPDDAPTGSPPGERGRPCPVRRWLGLTYRRIFELILRRVPPEAAHALAGIGVRSIGRVPILRGAARRWLGPPDPVLRVHALGMTFPSPLGVAAGMDKGATWFEGLGPLGFGFVEVGTVTAQPQRGNPRPRVHRLIPDRALINSMGFPNPGAEVARDRLGERTGETIVAVNVGKSKAAPIEQAGADYRAAVGRVARSCDFLVLNVSSPNTPELRALQGVERLEALLEEVQAELARQRLPTPVLVKLAPDLADTEIDAIADLAVRRGLAGIVAVNTTLSREGLASDAEVVNRPGGVSGAPLKRRAVQVLERLHARVGNDLVLISVGGVEGAEDVLERMRAGATLVQAYTGFVYGGPMWPRRVNRELAALVRRSGAQSVQALVGGTTARPGEGDRRPRART